MITANRDWSTRRRRSNELGTNDPVRPCSTCELLDVRAARRASCSTCELLEMLEGADAEGRISQAAATTYQALIEAALSSVIGAGLHERSDGRTTQRNGHRPNTLTTTAGHLQLQIPS